MTTPTTLPHTPLTPSTTNGAGRELPSVERLASTAHAAIDQAAAKAAPVVERVQDKVQEVEELRAQWMQSCRETVRAHPLSSVAFGVLAGWIVARLNARD